MSTARMHAVHLAVPALLDHTIINPFGVETVKSLDNLRKSLGGHEELKVDTVFQCPTHRRSPKSCNNFPHLRILFFLENFTKRNLQILWISTRIAGLSTDLLSLWYEEKRYVLSLQDTSHAEHGCLHSAAQ